MGLVKSKSYQLLCTNKYEDIIVKTIIFIDKTMQDFSSIWHKFSKQYYSLAKR